MSAPGRQVVRVLRPELGGIERGEEPHAAAGGGGAGAGEPGLAAMARGLGAAMVQVAAGAAAGGGVLVEPAAYRRRLEVCRACEWWREGARLGLGKCRKCGCTRLKLRLAALACPAGKWPAEALHGAGTNRAAG